MTRATHYCTQPCEFNGCESTMPQIMDTFTDNGTSIYYPKYTNDNITYPNSLSLYPNPVNENLEVQIFSTEFGILNLLIYDIYGRLVSNRTLNKHNNGTLLYINTSGLASGIYNVVVSLNDLFFPNKLFIKIN